MHEQQFLHPPLLVLSNFGLPHIHMKAVAAALQSALPAINVHKVLQGQNGGVAGSWKGRKGGGRGLGGSQMGGKGSEWHRMG